MPSTGPPPPAASASPSTTAPGRGWPPINTNFHDGAWLHFPVSVSAGGALTIRVDRLAGANVVLNGLFLGD